MSFFKELLPQVQAFAFDVDGVYSNTNLFLHPNGDMMRSMSTKDGFATKLAVESGFPLAIITGGYSEAVRQRFNGLGVTDVYIKSTDKLDDFEDFMYKYSLDPKRIMYMGDDIPDFEVMKFVGIPVCPADACEEIKSISLYISDKNGGEGCVRDVLEQVLRSQGKWGFKDGVMNT